LNKLQQELNIIKPSDQLVADTMKKMHEENKKLRANMDGDHGVDSHKGGIIPYRKRTWIGLAAVAACVAIAVGGFFVGRSSADVPMVALRTDSVVFHANATSRGGEDVKETILFPEEFELRANFNAESRFPGFVCVSAEAASFQNTSGDILGDYGVFVYQKDEARLTLYVSTSDQTAPSALLLAKKVRVGSLEVQFGVESDTKIYYAAWTDHGTAFCLESQGMTQRSFIVLMRKTFS